MSEQNNNYCIQQYEITNKKQHKADQDELILSEMIKQYKSSDLS